jgi:3-hydroxy-9,10-secoandrosta-1,3,5(10)-triene-9,17-dione monooxygenase reductase component
VTEPQGRIHYEDPFATPAELREPARRLRGRLAAPVTVWTAGGSGTETGLTISSLLVAEGAPALVLGLVSPTSDLWEAIRDTGKFVVHILDEGNDVVSQRFAGTRPSPGGLFADVRTEKSEWGPVLIDFGNRAMCSLQEGSEVGLQVLIRGAIDEIVLTDIDEPLVYFRGRYRSTRPRD